MKTLLTTLLLFASLTGCKKEDAPQSYQQPDCKTCDVNVKSTTQGQAPVYYIESSTVVCNKGWVTLDGDVSTNTQTFAGVQITKTKTTKCH